jgi:hypothetical protein
MVCALRTPPIALLFLALFLHPLLLGEAECSIFEAECSIFWFRLVAWAMKAWCDGVKWLEVRPLHLLPKKFKSGCVITLDGLGNWWTKYSMSAV